MIGIDILSKDNVFSRWVLVTFDDPGFDDFDVVDDLNFIFAGLSWKQTPVEVGNGRFPFGLESPIDSFADRIRIAYFDFQIVFSRFSHFECENRPFLRIEFFFAFGKFLLDKFGADL